MTKQTVGELAGIYREPRTFQPSNLLLDTKCYTGVEIELENTRGLYQKYFKSGFWTVYEDGSLRNYGTELIMGVAYDHKKYHPLLGQDIITALDDLDSGLKAWTSETGRIPEATYRTGLHIHLDVRDLVIEELRRLVLLFIIFERSLFAYSSDGRESSSFCRPVFSTDQIKEDLIEFFTTSREESSITCLSGFDKYHACNLLSITHRGSIEFRMHRGTYNSDEILRWINILIALKIAAQNKDLIIGEIPERISAYGMMDFHLIVFKSMAESLMPFATTENILAGVRTAQEILRLKGLKKDHVNYARSSLGKKAGKDSILHKFAEQNNREVYLEGDSSSIISSKDEDIQEVGIDSSIWVNADS